MRRRRPRVLVLALALVALLPACGSGPGGDGPAGDGGTTLTVFAAASLRTTFTRLGETFEASHPGTTVTFSFAGSADLLAQLKGGAPADVLATADTKTMDAAAADGLLKSSPVVFAANTLQIAVPPDNPAGISSLADLTRPGVRLVTCAPAVPCGAAAQQVATRAGVTLRPVSEESSVTDVLNKVSTGEADAGLVYVTDVRAAGDKVVGVALPEATSVVLRYPIGVLTDSAQAALATEFVTLVTGSEGRQVLTAAGFAEP